MEARREREISNQAMEHVLRIEREAAGVLLRPASETSPSATHAGGQSPLAASVERVKLLQHGEAFGNSDPPDLGAGRSPLRDRTQPHVGPEEYWRETLAQLLLRMQGSIANLSPTTASHFPNLKFARSFDGRSLRGSHTAESSGAPSFERVDASYRSGSQQKPKYNKVTDEAEKLRGLTGSKSHQKLFGVGGVISRTSQAETAHFDTLHRRPKRDIVEECSLHTSFNDIRSPLRSAHTADASSQTREASAALPPGEAPSSFAEAAAQDTTARSQQHTEEAEIAAQLSMARSHALASEAEAAAREAEADARTRAVEAHAYAEMATEQAHARTVEAKLVAELEHAKLQARVAEQGAAADAAAVHASARIAEAEAAVEAVVRSAQTRAQAAEIAAQGRAERAQLIGQQSDRSADLWESRAGELPSGLAQRMLDAVQGLEGEDDDHFKAAGGALWRAFELQAQITNKQEPITNALIVTWGLGLAAALDAVLQLGVPAALPSLQAIPPLPSGTSTPSAQAVRTPQHASSREPEVSKRREVPAENQQGWSLPVSPSSPSISQLSAVGLPASSDDTSTYDGECGSAPWLALPPESDISLTVGQVQSSLNIESSRLQSERRTAQLQIGLQRCLEQQADRSEVHGPREASLDSPAAAALQHFRYGAASKQWLSLAPRSLASTERQGVNKDMRDCVHTTPQIASPVPSAFQRRWHSLTPQVKATMPVSGAVRAEAAVIPVQVRDSPSLAAMAAAAKHWGVRQSLQASRRKPTARSNSSHAKPSGVSYSMELVMRRSQSAGREHTPKSTGEVSAPLRRSFPRGPFTPQ